ncbi:MAG: hypothetical protein KDI79_30920 [Anaerolineae bacterium]|nr:hypothetical protein [Anaerolineae bacterium]
MKQQLTHRLHELKAEFDAGQKMMAELEAKQANLRETLLRISGAIQVIEEELSRAASPEDVNLTSNGHSEHIEPVTEFETM